ncbi:hypothetical protein [Desulfonatronospira sp.]|uniref:hypothetical protein n=1 Tax=Desulfonatronospira sp. TaxID=1962951 RepID=UPI0025C5F60A|nr:hypothetical protein [Desulfonatronospira sp.]
MQERKRHGCLTIWLVVVIGANFLDAFRHYLMRDELMEQFPGTPEWVITGLFILALVNVACGIALFRWKKWGFWVLLLSSLAGAYLYLQLSFVNALVPLLVVAVLFGVLHIGGERRGWDQLE